MRGTHTTVLTCLLALALTACTADDDPDATPPSPTVATRSTSASSAPATDPKAPPELPPAAREKTTAGAKAFVRYYVEVINFGFTNNASEPLRASSSRSCKVCEELARTIERNKRGGGGQVGGTWSPVDVSFVHGVPAARPVAVTALDIAKGYYTEEAGGPRHPIRTKRIIYEFWLQRFEGSWVISDVRPTR